MRNNLSCSSSILAAGCELDRSEQSIQGGPGMDWVSPERQRRVLGSGVTLWGAPPAGPRRSGRARAKIIWSLPYWAGVWGEPPQLSIGHSDLGFNPSRILWGGYIRTKYRKYKTCFGGCNMDPGSKSALHRLLSTIDCSFIFYHRWGSKYWSICSHHKYHICHHCSEDLRFLENA